VKFLDDLHEKRATVECRPHNEYDSFYVIGSLDTPTKRTLRLEDAAIALGAFLFDSARRSMSQCASAQTARYMGVRLAALWDNDNGCHKGHDALAPAIRTESIADVILMRGEGTALWFYVNERSECTYLSVWLGATVLAVSTSIAPLSPEDGVSFAVRRLHGL
jgi:hypothetical protein